MSAIVITGTDTGVGKTLFAAALTGALGAHYWKPVQSGPDDEGGSDSERVARLTGIPATQVLPEVYRLAEPLSPHRAAELDGKRFDGVGQADRVFGRRNFETLEEFAE